MCAVGVLIHMAQQVQEQMALHAAMGGDQQRQLALLQQWTQVGAAAATAAALPCSCHLLAAFRLAPGIFCPVICRQLRGMIPTVTQRHLPGTVHACVGVQKVLGCIKGMQQQWRQLVQVMRAAVAETAGQLQQQGGVLKQLQEQQAQGQQPQAPLLPAEPQLEPEQAQQQPSPALQQEQQETAPQATADPGAPPQEAAAGAAPAAAATVPRPTKGQPAAVPPARGAPAEGLPPPPQKPEQQAHLSRLALMSVLQQQMLAVQAVETTQGEQLAQLSQVPLAPRCAALVAVGRLGGRSAVPWQLTGSKHHLPYLTAHCPLLTWLA